MKIGPALLAGLAAGLWINLSGLALVHFVLGPEYIRTMMSHVPSSAELSPVRHLSVRFGFGILSVFLYAALRPQFSHSAAAALAAGFLFLAAYLPVGIMLNEFAILVGWRLWTSLLWGVGELAVAVVLGAYGYRQLSG